MKYGDFLKEMSDNANGAAMIFKEDIKMLKKDILLPDFYDKLAQLKGYEIRQAQFFID
jgi:hypothetical protein